MKCSKSTSPTRWLRSAYAQALDERTVDVHMKVLLRNRLGWVTGTLAAFLLLGGGIYFTASFDHSSTHGKDAPAKPAQRPDVRYYGELDLGVPYGATQAQVRRRLGVPSSRHGSCWLYVGSAIHGRYSDPDVDAMKFCFSAEGTGPKGVTKILSHFMASKTAPARWGHPLVILRVPDSYVQQDS